MATYNVPLDYESAIKQHDRIRTSKGYQASFEQVAEIARHSGYRFAVPTIKQRDITVKPTKDGIQLRMPAAKGDKLQVGAATRRPVTIRGNWSSTEAKR